MAKAHQGFICNINQLCQGDGKLTIPRNASSWEFLLQVTQRV